MADERIDIYDENNIRIGDEMKSIAHQQALWHRSAHIWIIDGQGNMLLQRRSEDKATFPGLRDISAAGHIGLGETYVLGAERVRGGVMIVSRVDRGHLHEKISR